MGARCTGAVSYRCRDDNMACGIWRGLRGRANLNLAGHAEAGSHHPGDGMSQTQ